MGEEKVNCPCCGEIVNIDEIEENETCCYCKT